MARRGLTSLFLSLILLLSALGGGAPRALALPMPAQAPQSCPCQPEQSCQCAADSPCHMSQELPDAPAPMVVGSQDWPQAPGLAFWRWVAAPQGWSSQVAGRPAPPAPPPGPLYLQKSSLLI